MLAQNFQTAKALGITDEQLEALIKTLGFFERGEIPASEFYMNSWENECGTGMCLGGWSAHFAGRKIFVGHQRSSGLHYLFHPSDNLGALHSAYECRDPAKGAHALRNYLTTGEADWPSVMAEPA